MAGQSNIYAGVAGYVGRPEEKGSVGVFRRAAAGGEWQHVLKHLETHTVFVHPTDPRRGVRRHRRRRVAQHRSRRHLPAHELPRQGQADLVVPGRLPGTPSASMPAARRSTSIAATTAAQSWRRLPNPGIKDRATAPFAVARHAHGAAPDAARRDLRRAGDQRRDPHHRRRRDLGGLQRRPDPPVGAAAPQEQDRQRHLRRGHAGRARHHHQPGRSRRRGRSPAAWACSAPPTRARAGRTWR